MSLTVNPIWGPKLVNSLSQPDQYDWLLAYVKATIRPFFDPPLLLALALLAVALLLELELLPHPAANAAAAARTAKIRISFTLRNVPLLSAFRSFHWGRQRRLSRGRFGRPGGGIGPAPWCGARWCPARRGLCGIRHVPEDFAGGGL